MRTGRVVAVVAAAVGLSPGVLVNLLGAANQTSGLCILTKKK